MSKYNQIQMKTTIIRALCWDEDPDEDDVEEFNKWELVFEGKWEDDGKYDFCEYIIKDKLSGKHYSYTLSRSGSYHTDWYYGWDDEKESELCEVQRVTKTIVTWEYIKVE